MTEPRSFHILITNDDGVFHPGLLALVRAVRSIPGVTYSILAPERNWSASGHVKTLHRPLRVREVRLTDGTKALASDGAPSDCVALATLGLLEKPIDLVVSGINPTANLGYDVSYSGTVTAAMEAAISGIPGVAFSLNTPEEEIGHPNYAAAEVIARKVIEQVLGHELPKGVFLNVNIPYGPLENIKGFQITRMGLRVYRDRLERRVDPRGVPYYWIGGDVPTGYPEPGTDIGAVAMGYVSITPLHLDFTAYTHIPYLQTWEWDTLLPAHPNEGQAT